MVRVSLGGSWLSSKASIFCSSFLTSCKLKAARVRRYCFWKNRKRATRVNKSGAVIILHENNFRGAQFGAVYCRAVMLKGAAVYVNS